ncbi:MAG: hypothetical protein K2N89_07820, partial [Lachnospiraceae bacterium]|nr:hypothetical protein [Lachnospiraceae bacterium]
NMGEDSVDVVTAGERTEVTYQTNDYGNQTEILVTVIDPNGEASEEKLHATAPGKYTTEIPTSQTGLYHFNIRRTEGGEIRSYMTTAAAVQFSDEYKFDVSADAYLRFADQYGRRITEEDSVWTRITTGARESYPLTNLLTAFAICLFLADIAMRRFQYEPKFAGVRGRKQKKAAETDGGKAQEESAVQTLPTIQPAEPVLEETQDKKQKTERKPKTTKKAKQSEQVLDTSQLLKKKDERNQ